MSARLLQMQQFQVGVTGNETVASLSACVRLNTIYTSGEDNDFSAESYINWS